MGHPPQESPAGGWRHLLLSRRPLAAAVLLVAVVFLITSNTFWRWMYPIGYQTDIQQAGALVHIDPLLVASVIRVESQFHSADVSHAGAVGLMQLMPDTALWIAGQWPDKRWIPGPLPGNQAERLAQLANPSVNIRLGSWYLHYLIERFHGNQVAAVAAYNAGPQRVEGWLADGVWDGRLQSSNEIPVGETRHFVGRVFYNYALYERIYGDDPAWRFPRQTLAVRLS
ncbi:MAG: lytic transglycosylase domain-containing protein [Alicyclobacillus sp.]|nr:lytic transglycosylase domain-containing protein [Alicyclobacillus sp.]